MQSIIYPHNVYFDWTHPSFRDGDSMANYSVLLLTLYKKIKQSKNTNTFQILLVFALEIVSETESR